MKFGKLKIDEKVISANFLKLSVFAALAILALVLTTAVLAHMVSADDCTVCGSDCDACGIGCDACGSACNICSSGCDACDDCDSGCDSCNVRDGECEEGYLDCYRCSGNKRQRLWVNEDCTREWRTVERCAGSCKDGRCVSCIISTGEVSPSRPSDKFERETAYTTVKVHNTDSKGHWYDLSTYVCKSDCYSGCSATDCREMVCDTARLYVPAGDTKYVKCSRFMPAAGYYRIKVEYKVDCSTSKRTVYSDKFRIVGECSGFTGGCDGCVAGSSCTVGRNCEKRCDYDICRDDSCKEYRCFGNFLQKRYKNENCEWRWEIVEYCPYGCDGDKCVLPASSARSLPHSVQSKVSGKVTLLNVGEPKVFTRVKYEMKKCGLSSFSFTLQNKGKADTFELSVEGDAADWIDVPEFVYMDEGENKRVTAYADVPCEAEAGLHEFTITAVGRTTDSAKSYIKVEKAAGIFTLSPTTDLVLIIIVVVVFAAAIMYGKKFGFAYSGKLRKPGYKRPEEFDKSSGKNSLFKF